MTATTNKPKKFSSLGKLKRILHASDNRRGGKSIGISLANRLSGKEALAAHNHPTGIGTSAVKSSMAPSLSSNDCMLNDCMLGEKTKNTQKNKQKNNRQINGSIPDRMKAWME